MLMKEQIILSFVKGIAKTSGVVTILALVSGIWYMVNETINCYTDDNKETVKDENNVIVENTDLLAKDDNMSYIEAIHEEDRVEDSKYRYIFDKLVL